MSGKTQRIGTRAQVWHQTAQQTPGGLKKSDLIMNKHGRIVSREKHNTAKKEMRLLKFGYGTKKGKFGFVKTRKGSRSQSTKMKGGKMTHASASKMLRVSGGMGHLSPSNVNWHESNSNESDSPLTRALTAGGKRRKHTHRGGTIKYSNLSPSTIEDSINVQLRAGEGN